MDAKMHHAPTSATKSGIRVLFKTVGQNPNTAVAMKQPADPMSRAYFRKRAIVMDVPPLQKLCDGGKRRSNRLTWSTTP